MSTTGEFLRQHYIKDLVDNTLLAFQLMPEEISETSDVAWQDQEVSGRSFPVKGYAYSNARIVTLTLQFFDDLGDVVSQASIRNIINWLRSLKEPDYSSGFIRPPHPVLVNCGNYLTMKGVVMNVQISHRSPWEINEKRPKFIEANLSIAESEDFPLGVYKVRGSRLPGSGSKTELNIATTAGGLTGG